MRIEIPGYKTMDLKYLILDYNGTIAKDGIIPESVKERLKKLSGIYEIYVLTADTHGTARKICEGLPLKIQTFPGNAAAEEKRTSKRKNNRRRQMRKQVFRGYIISKDTMIK